MVKPTIPGSNPDADKTEDELELEQFNNFLKRQQAELRRGGSLDPCDGLIPPENLKRRAVIEEAKLRMWTKTRDAAQIALDSANAEVSALEENVSLLRQSFDERVKLVLAQLILEMRGLDIRLKILLSVENPPMRDINELRNEINAKLARIKKLSRLSEYGILAPEPEAVEEYTGISTLERTEVAESLVKLMNAKICANPRCRRSKLGFYPLCRTCAKLQTEGKIDVKWAGIGIRRNVEEKA